MKTKKRLLSVLALLVLFASAPALAQPPANDDFDAATVISSLPFEEWANTAEATNASDDPDLFPGATVWYSFTPLTDTSLEANTFGSEYDTMLFVWIGDRGSLQLIDYNDDAGGGLESRVRFAAAAGTTYHLMVGSFGGSPGGNLHFFMDVAPPPPPPLDLSFDIDPTGSFDPKSRVVKITGKVYSSRFASYYIEGVIWQRVGHRAMIVGSFSYYGSADGEGAWQGYVGALNGRFAAGNVDVSAYLGCYDPEREEYISLETFRTVGIRGQGKSK